MKNGFTLLEVVIALLIVAILATGLLPALASLTKASLNSELVYAVPGIAQTKLETDKVEEGNNVYLDKFGIKMNSTSTKLNDDLEVSTVTVKTGESGYVYSYSLSTLKDTTNEETENATFTSSTIATEISTTSSTSTTEPQSTGSTIWDPEACTSGLQGSAADTPAYGDQYIEVRSGGDGIISYGLKFEVPTASNYIIIAIPGNTDREEEKDKKDNDKKYIYSYVAFVYKNNENSLPDACDFNNPKKGQTPELPRTSTTREERSGNGGAFLFPEGLSTATVVYQYTLLAKEQPNKRAWSLRLSIKFLEGTPTANQWVRIYIPNSSGQVPSAIPQTTEEVTVANYTFQINPSTVSGLIAWDSITFDLSDNASVTVKVGTASMTNPYVFHATGPATQVNIIIGYLPLGEKLNVQFTLAPINNTNSASISNVKVFYRTVATSP